jgi:hypothetical protein
MVKEKQTVLFIEYNQTGKLQNYLARGYVVAFVVPQSVSTSVANQFRASNEIYGGFLIILNNPE